MTRTSLDAQFMRSICSSTQKTFSVQAGIEVRAGAPCLWRAELTREVAVIGMMEIDAAFFTGSIGIAFTPTVFLTVYEKMFGEVHPSISDELRDAAAEFMNIIYGLTKAELNQLPGYELKPILPAVVFGPALATRHATDRAVMMLPFECDAGLFHLEVAVERKARTAAA